MNKILINYSVILKLHCIVPPTIIDSESSPSQLSVRENARVSLICRGHGVPPPRLNWKREDGRSFIEGHSSARQPKQNGQSPNINWQNLSMILTCSSHFQSGSLRGYPRWRILRVFFSFIRYFAKIL